MHHLAVHDYEVFQALTLFYLFQVSATMYFDTAEFNYNLGTFLSEQGNLLIQSYKYQIIV